MQLIWESLNSIAPHARSGKVRALAVSGARRSPGFPDLPTIAEAGVPGYEAGTWTGIIAPSGLPQPIIAKLNGALGRGLPALRRENRLKRWRANATRSTRRLLSCLLIVDINSLE